MAAKDTREFDIIIFGATGYTGQYVIEELANSVKSELKWAVAGRSEQKLRESLEIVQSYLGNGIDILGTTVIQADVKDPASLSEMCRRTKLILNCVGPYKLYGEAVVSACVESKTHHVDISGELKYLETVQAKYFMDAREKGIYIVGACGFDSIPSDYGISLLKQKFAGDLNSVEYYIKIGSGPEGRTVNIGTFLSVIYSVQDAMFSKQFNGLLKENVFKKEIVKSDWPLSWNWPPLFFSNKVNSWCCWFIGPDERVIERSQMFRNEYLNERPIESHGYLQVSSLCTALFYMFIFGVLGFLSLFSFGRNLLAKYPSFFTAGAFSATGPTRKQVEEGSTEITFFAEGWSKKLSEEPSNKHSSKPDKRLKLTLSGPELTYPLTAMCMVQAALVILQEKEKLPLEGGVLTPGIAFEQTTLHERLARRGMVFNYDLGD